MPNINFPTYFACIADLQEKINTFNSLYDQQDQLFDQCVAASKSLSKIKTCTTIVTNALATCQSRIKACGYKPMMSASIAPQGAFYESEQLSAPPGPNFNFIVNPVPRFNWEEAVPGIGFSRDLCNALYNGQSSVPTTLQNGTVVQQVPGKSIIDWNGILFGNVASLQFRLDTYKDELPLAFIAYAGAVFNYEKCCNTLNLFVLGGCTNSHLCNDPSDPIMQLPTRDACIPEDKRNDGVI
jgi:hypothetical protein